MIDYRDDIMILIEKCLHAFAEQRIVEMGIEQSWQSRLASEVKNRYPLYPTDYMLLHRFLQNHTPNEIDLKNLDTTAMCALYNNIPDFIQMCEIQTAQKRTFLNHINNLKNSRNTIEHYVRGILPEQYKEFHFDQLNALYNISAFASLAERHCPSNDIWKNIILESTQLERGFHWEKWMLPSKNKNQVLYSDDNLSDIIVVAESGDVESQIQAGKVFFYGDRPGSKPDYDRAFFWFSKAVISDNPEVKYHLALCLKHIPVLNKYKGNTYLVNELIEESAKQGYAPAQYDTALNCYEQYRENQDKESITQLQKWLMLACKQEHPQALWLTAWCLKVGLFHSKKKNLYNTLLNRSSELGCGQASITLGHDAEEQGDYDNALKWYSLAEEQGYKDPEFRRKKLQRKMKEKR